MHIEVTGLLAPWRSRKRRVFYVLGRNEQRPIPRDLRDQCHDGIWLTKYAAKFNIGDNPTTTYARGSLANTQLNMRSVVVVPSGGQLAPELRKIPIAQERGHQYGGRWSEGIDKLKCRTFVRHVIGELALVESCQLVLVAN
jgi:hypothetical protein